MAKPAPTRAPEDIAASMLRRRQAAAEKMAPQLAPATLDRVLLEVMAGREQVSRAELIAALEGKLRDEDNLMTPTIRAAIKALRGLPAPPSPPG